MGNTTNQKRDYKKEVDDFFKEEEVREMVNLIMDRDEDYDDIPIEKLIFE